MSEPERSLPTVSATPFLKWAGGKNQLLTQYRAYLPGRDDIGRYVEPFCGGAAVFFRQRYPLARLADVNHDVIEAYQVVRDRAEELIEALAVHRNAEDYFYQVRDAEPAAMGPVERVARFIFLNRTCYNGLHRVNRDGRFNVPFGRYKNPRICDAPGLRACSAALQGVELQCGDFQAATADLRAGDFVYFDPPYVPTSATANFTDYSVNGFSEADQRRLAKVYHDLDGRGCKLMLSNSDTPLVRELYRGHGYPIIEIQARRAINSDPAGRGPVTELLVINYPRPTRGR